MYRRRRGAFGGLYSILWIFIVILFFITHSWIVFLVGVLLSAILGMLIRMFMAGAIGAGLFGAASMMRNQQQPPQYQAPYQPYRQPEETPYYQPPPQPPYQSYEQGYQPPPQAPGSYQEGEQPYYQPTQQQPQPQYEQPQVQYPQEMPPQQ